MSRSPSPTPVVQTSPLCTVPPELLERIALQLVDLDPLGPPGSDLVNLLCTCDRIYQTLDIVNYSFYAKLFCRKFDVTGGARRGYHHFNSEDLAAQLVHYSRTLKDVSRHLWHSDYEGIYATFWMCLVMMLENDGKNREQLVHAGLDTLVNRFVRTRLWAGMSSEGWPEEDEEKALALWLMWLLSTPESIASESDSERQEILTLVLPYVVVNYRYASAHVPANHFYLPFRISTRDDGELIHFPFSVETAHGPYPCYRDLDPVTLPSPFYREDLLLAVPPISTPAKLLYFSRKQIRPFGILPFLPATRAVAIAQGQVHIGPTREDIMELNSHWPCPLPPKSDPEWWMHLGEEQWRAEVGAFSVPSRATGASYSPIPLKALSEKWDHDWNRWTHCFDPRLKDWTPLCYTPGSMNGLWQGRMLIPDEASYQRLITMPDMPVNFGEDFFHLTIVPFYMRLEEFQCHVAEGCIPAGGAGDGFDDGAQNAWFPRGMSQYETVGGLRVDVDGHGYYYDKFRSRSGHDSSACIRCRRDSEQDEQRRKRYEEGRRAASAYEHEFASVGLGNSPDEEMEREYYGKDRCDGVEDIILAGSTDLKHGQAWNHFLFYGRVRRWDGLVGILRLSRDQYRGNIFLYGYLVGGQNFVGNWRMANAEMGVPAWECAFTMSRSLSDE